MGYSWRLHWPLTLDSINLLECLTELRKTCLLTRLPSYYYFLNFNIFYWLCYYSYPIFFSPLFPSSLCHPHYHSPTLVHVRLPSYYKRINSETARWKWFTGKVWGKGSEHLCPWFQAHHSPSTITCSPTTTWKFYELSPFRFLWRLHYIGKMD